MPAWQRAPYKTVPAGVYPIGHRAYENNPPREVTLKKPLQVKQTVVTQSEFLAVRGALGDQNHLVVVLVSDNQQAIVARGTKAAIEDLSGNAIVGIAREHLFEGGLLTHSQVEPFEMSMRILRFALEPECGWENKVEPQFLYDDYPAYASLYMARAVAALSLEGDRLLTSEEWEVAAGDLRKERYLDPQELAEVAVFGRSLKEGPTPVGTKRPNQYGLQDMLGLVWEYVANEEVVRGGSWRDMSMVVRVAFLGQVNHLDVWNRSVGFRLLRPHQTTGGQAQDSPG